MYLKIRSVVMVLINITLFSVYTGEIIKKFFSDHPDHSLNALFHEHANFSGSRSYIYEYKKILPNNIEFFFQNIFEHRCRPIIENGEVVGHFLLKQPDKITITQGSFTCFDVTKIQEKPAVSKWRNCDVTVKRMGFPFRNKLQVHIDNNNLNIRITCKSIMPTSITHIEEYPPHIN